MLGRHGIYVILQEEKEDFRIKLNDESCLQWWMHSWECAWKIDFVKDNFH